MLTVASATINGTLAIELAGSSADRLNVTGNLDITNATLALTGTPTAPEYVIASFGTVTGSRFPPSPACRMAMQSSTTSRSSRSSSPP